MEKFEIIEELGTGSFGVALLCMRLEDGEGCVVKKVKLRELSKRDALVAQREVAVMQRVQHPYIIEYFDSFVEDEFMHIVMSYAAGGTLHDVIRKARTSGAIPEQQILRYVAQVTLAVRHLHQHRILHRDLKSANIFLDAAGDVKLGDFGLSRMLSSHSQFAKTTVGTPNQLSPELCHGKPYGAESDAWSLGCLFYEIAARRYAFQGGSLPVLLMKIMKGDYPSLSARGSSRTGNAEYSAELIEIIDGCLTVTAADRWTPDDIVRPICPLFLSKCFPVQARTSLCTVNSMHMPRSWASQFFDQW
eukprot:SAG31_NODE_4806_length_2945_cov_14.704849_2_plen_304_part_00